MTEDGSRDDRVEHDTGHDVHFLSRLDRVSVQQTDLALRLYRAPDLVRRVLADRTLPEAADRVAIAIEAGEGPPHVIVARDGAFVTCLAAGMEVGAQPVVPFARLQLHLDRAARAAAAHERAGAVLEDRTHASRLMDAIYEAGPGLSREQFRELQAVEPVMRRSWWNWLHRALQRVMRVGARVVRIPRVRKADEPLLRAYWGDHHALGHLFVLTALGGHGSFAGFADPVAERDADGAPLDPFRRFYAATLFMGHRPIYARILWALGRAGKVALPWLKRGMNDGRTLLDWAGAALGLVTIAFAHQKLRTEAARFLQSHRLPPALAESTLAPLAQDRLRHLAGLLLGELADLAPDELRRWWPHWVRATAFSAQRAEDFLVAQAAGDGQAAAAFEAAMQSVNHEQLQELGDPERLATDLVNRPVWLWEHQDHLLDLMTGTAMLASLPAEMFFYPQAELDAAVRFTPESAHALARCFQPRGPARAAAKPGRNEPCPCGSGKKYKRCCGAA